MSRHLCPYWVGRFLISPLRKPVHNPEKILAPFVAVGMTVLDVGAGLGYFSLPLADFVGRRGRVVCADVQEKMLQTLKRRATAVGLQDRIILRVSQPRSLNMHDFLEKIDFALAFAVVHEVEETAEFFADLHGVLKPGALCLLVEPKGHVRQNEFENMVTVADRNGLRRIGGTHIKLCHSAILKKD